MSLQNKDLLIPHKLSPGDTIGVAAPAGHFNTEIFFQGISVLESMGFRVRVPNEIFSQSGYFAGTDALRADLLERLFKDDSVKAIVCARGGFGSVKTLPLLDFKIITDHPKILIGYSDISVLLNVFFEKSRLVTFHGPVVTSLANADRQTKEKMLTALTSDERIEIHARNPLCIQSGEAVGTVMGGNLATLCHLIGTPYMPSFSSRILVLEDTNEACYRIDRMLTQMKLSGSLEGIAGLALGTFEQCGRKDALYGVIENIFEGRSIPIAAGFDIGHGKRNMIFPVGIEATLDADKGSLCFHHPATR